MFIQHDYNIEEMHPDLRNLILLSFSFLDRKNMKSQVPFFSSFNLDHGCFISSEL